MKAKTNKILVFILIFILLLGLFFGGLLVYHKFFYDDKAYIGKWSREVDVTEYVTSAMNIWVDSSLHGDIPDFGDEKVSITLVMTFDENGNWAVSPDAESIKAANEQAIRVAGVGLSSFIEKRLIQADTFPEDVDKTVDELIEDAIGMSAEDYIREYGPQLLPDETDFVNMYARSGAYSVKGGVLARDGIAEDTLYEKYVVQDDYLILVGQSNSSFEIESNKEGLSALATSIDDTADTASVSNSQEGQTIIYPVIFERR